MRPAGSSTLYNTIVAQNTDAGSLAADDMAGTLSTASADNLFGTGRRRRPDRRHPRQPVQPSPNPGLGTARQQRRPHRRPSPAADQPRPQRRQLQPAGRPRPTARSIRGASNVPPATSIDIGAFEAQLLLPGHHARRTRPSPVRSAPPSTGPTPTAAPARFTSSSTPREPSAYPRPSPWGSARWP